MFATGIIEGLRQAIYAIEHDRKEIQPSGNWPGMNCVIAAIERAIDRQKQMTGGDCGEHGPVIITTASVPWTMAMGGYVPTPEQQEIASLRQQVRDFQMELEKSDAQWMRLQDLFAAAQAQIAQLEKTRCVASGNCWRRPHPRRRPTDDDS